MPRTTLRVALLLTGAALAAAPAAAETLREALAKAYATSPTLTASRAGLRALDENVPIARSSGLPAVSATGGYNRALLSGGNSITSPEQQATSGINLTQPLFTGGSVRNSIRAAETRVEAGRSTLRGTEADLFTAVTGAYMDVIRDEAIVRLNQQNVRVLGVNLDASRDRFQVGDLTRTDVAQSEARLALSRAQLQQAQARLIGSRENYVRLVGTAPGTLEPPPELPNLPASPDAAVRVALGENPNLQAAKSSRDATDFDISVARAARLPRVNVVLGGNYYDYLGSLGAGTGIRVGQTGSSTTAGVAVTLPLFQGGRPAAQIRQAQARRSQAIEQVTDTERGVVAQTRSAYAGWRSSLEVIQSAEAAVKANQLSLEGVRAENGVGNRTILDILNAEQELLNSQVTLVTARRDAYVAGFALLAAMGRAEADDLGLDGGSLYNPVTNYERVRRRFSDFSADDAPQPQAVTTADTPAQGSDPGPAPTNDPLLQPPVDNGGALTTGANTPGRRGDGGR